MVATGVLLGKAIKRLVGGDVSGRAGDIVEDKVDALAARIDVVDVLASRKGACVGEVVGNRLQGGDDGRVVRGPGRAAGVAACGGDAQERDEGGCCKSWELHDWKSVSFLLSKRGLLLEIAVFFIYGRLRGIYVFQ